jgi:NTE family protein
LLFTGFEKSANRFGASLHHDSYRGVGLVANYTGRNVLGSASRLLFNIDIAEQPKVMLQYQKNFGERRNWWWQAEAKGLRLKQKLFVDGVLAEDLNVDNFGITGRINKNLNALKSYVGFGINYGDTQIKPSISPDLSDNVLDLIDYDSKSLSLDARYVFNTMNEVFYATEGRILEIVLTRSIKQDINLVLTDTTISGRTNGFTKLQVGYQKRFPFNSTITGIL